MLEIRTIQDLISNYSVNEIPRLKPIFNEDHIITLEDINNEIICKKYNNNIENITNYGLYYDTNNTIFCFHNIINEIIIDIPITNISCFGGNIDLQAFLSVSLFKNKEFVKNFKQKIHPLWKINNIPCKNKEINIASNLSYNIQKYEISCEYWYNGQLYRSSLLIQQEANIPNKYVENQLSEKKITFSINDNKIGANGGILIANTILFYTEEKKYKDSFKNYVKTEESELLSKDITDLCYFYSNDAVEIENNIIKIPKQEYNSLERSFKIYCVYHNKTYCQEIIQKNGDNFIEKKILKIKDYPDKIQFNLPNNKNNDLTINIISETHQYINNILKDKKINYDFNVIVDSEWVLYELDSNNILTLHILSNSQFSERACLIKIYDNNKEIHINVIQPSNSIMNHEYYLNISNTDTHINQSNYQNYYFSINTKQKIYYGDGSYTYNNLINEDDQLVVLCNNKILSPTNNKYFISHLIENPEENITLNIQSFIQNKNSMLLSNIVNYNLIYQYDSSLIKKIEITVKINNYNINHTDLFSHNNGILKISYGNNQVIEKKLSNFWINKNMPYDIILHDTILCNIGEKYNFYIDKIPYNNGYTPLINETYLIEKDDIGIDLEIKLNDETTN